MLIDDDNWHNEPEVIEPDWFKAMKFVMAKCTECLFAFAMEERYVHETVEDERLSQRWFLQVVKVLQVQMCLSVFASVCL